MTDEQRKERIHHHIYETCEGIQEHAERIVSLEDLVQDFSVAFDAMCGQRHECDTCVLNDDDCSACESSRLGARMRELGIEVQA